MNQRHLLPFSGEVLHASVSCPALLLLCSTCSLSYCFVMYVPLSPYVAPFQHIETPANRNSRIVSRERVHLSGLSGKGVIVLLYHFSLAGVK